MSIINLIPLKHMSWYGIIVAVVKKSNLQPVEIGWIVRRQVVWRSCA